MNTKKKGQFIINVSDKFAWYLLFLYTLHLAEFALRNNVTDAALWVYLGTATSLITKIILEIK
ncbi:MAG TPA: hypothetical protein VJ987_09790 [Anaerolineales bacterium]|nr:hypothetical protein [Anaerolineales bacterium]